MPVVVACALALCATPAFAGGGDHHGKGDHFKLMDADGDGRISRAEHQAGARKMFTQCDANHDGMVTAAEMDAAKLGEGEKADKIHKSSAEKISMLDKDQDGKLTATEHDTGAESMFGKMDADGDGFLSKDEYKQGKKMKHKDQR